jgi:diguanylate cyclase (GGDEF)-like protein
VAVNQGNTNYDMWLSNHFPTWNRAYFADTPTGLDAVAAGEADCVIISNYRYSNISRQCEKLHLTTVYTGVDMDYCFAVNKGNTVLYTILAKANNAVPDAVIHTALTYYSTEDVKISFGDMVRDNLFVVLAAIAGILMIILLLLLRNIRSERKILEEERLVNSLNKRIFVDALTSVRNKGAFSDYIELLQERVDQGEQFDFAIGVFDCNNLKQINDRHGHDKGDEYLKAASSLICHVFQHSPVFRIGGDEFAAILENDDFRNREELVREFEERQKEACASAESEWNEVRVALGIAVYDPEHDRSVNDTARRADKLMYINKAMGKADH